MSCGSGLSGGSFTKVDWFWVLSPSILIFSLFGCFVYWNVSGQLDIARVSAASYAASKFHDGDIVRSRVTNFRGMVTGVSCYRSCQYYVRFYAATMQPVWVEEYEIKKAEPSSQPGHLK